MKCVDCGEIKVRIKSNRRRQLNRYYYVDQLGRLWNGHVCPQCKNSFNPVVNRKSKSIDNEIDDEFIYC